MGRIGEFTFSAAVWLHSGGTWHFVDVPVDVTDDIRELSEGMRGGFGSVRVAVTIGATSWRTSVFPAGDHYVLPLKKAVRTAEGLSVGEVADIRLELVDL